MRSAPAESARGERTAPARHRGHWGAALLVTAGLHAGLGAALLSARGIETPAALPTRVELEINTVPSPPPPVEAPVPVPLEAAPEPPRPRLARRPRLTPVPETPVPETPVPETPPPVEQPEPPYAAPRPEEPRTEQEAPPTFGVTPGSVTTGDSAMAVPVGGSVAGTKTGPGPGGHGTGTGTAPGSGPPGPPVFAPVGPGAVAGWPRVVHEEKPEFTMEARRLGVNALVVLRVGVDRTGKVRSVRVVKRAGHGLDEAATRAMWRYRFTPGKNHQGQAVDVELTYNMRFDHGP